MTIHIFNPEHDIALAANLSNFTSPHAGRQLRHDLGFLPALWAGADDVVIVDDVPLAQSAYKHTLQMIKRRLGRVPATDTGSLSHEHTLFQSWKQSVSCVDVSCIDPWGWNKALCANLRRIGIDDTLLPSESQLEHIRQLSHRRTSARLLPLLRLPDTIGESCECQSFDDVERCLQTHGRLVLKAPWSSSGRGLRFIDLERNTLSAQAGWLRNTLQRQGSVMAEPFYNKVKDFGMEFTAFPDGRIRYEGLSLFHTVNGAYTGNILATESVKEQLLSHYIATDLLKSVQSMVCQHLPALLDGKYCGPLGIDMMVVAKGTGEGFLLHPCVEINLRRTMGHVALALTPGDDDILSVMRISYAQGSYDLTLERLQSPL